MASIKHKTLMDSRRPRKPDFRKQPEIFFVQSNEFNYLDFWHPWAVLSNSARSRHDQRRAPQSKAFFESYFLRSVHPLPGEAYGTRSARARYDLRRKPQSRTFFQSFLIGPLLPPGSGGGTGTFGNLVPIHASIYAKRQARRAGIMGFISGNLPKLGAKTRTCP